MAGTLANGREAIRGYFAAVFQRVPTRQVTFGDQAVRVSGGIFAVTTGSYRFTGVTRDGQPRHTPARYSFVTVKRDGRWLIVDQHSSAIPAAPRLAGTLGLTTVRSVRMRADGVSP